MTEQLESNFRTSFKGESPQKGGELNKNSVSIFLSKYIDRLGNPTEHGLEVFKALNMDHMDLLDNSINKILQDDLAKENNAGPVKTDMKTMKTIAKVKLDRYEQKRLYKAQKIYQYELHQKYVSNQELQAKARGEYQRHSSPEISMIKNISKMPPLKILSDPSKNQIKTASLLGISGAQLKKMAIQQAQATRQNHGSMDALNSQQDGFGESFKPTEKIQFMSTQNIAQGTASSQNLLAAEIPVMLGQTQPAVSMLDKKTAAWIKVQQNRYNRRDQAKQHNEEKIDRYEKKIKAIQIQNKLDAKELSEQIHEKQEKRDQALRSKNQAKEEKFNNSVNDYKNMCSQMKQQRNLQNQLQRAPYRNLSSTHIESYDNVNAADPDAKRVGNAMFISQNKSTELNKSQDVSDFQNRNIPRKIKQNPITMSKTSNDYTRYEKSKELHEVILSKHKDGDELMAKLKEKLQQGEQRRLQQRDRSVEKLRLHNEIVQNNVDRIAETKAASVDLFPANFIDKMKKIHEKRKEKNQNMQEYVKEIREKSQTAMIDARHRKLDLDQEWRKKLHKGISCYESRYAERTQRIQTETRESCRLKSALTSQRIIDTKQQYMRLKNDRLQHNAFLIQKHEEQHKTLNQRKNMLTQFNDMTRTFNFTKNQAQTEFREEMVLANKLSPKQRKKYIQTNNLYEKFGAGNAYNSEPLSPGLGKEPDSGGFFITQSNPNVPAINIAARSQSQMNKNGIPKVELYR